MDTTHRRRSLLLPFFSTAHTVATLLMYLASLYRNSI